MRLLSEPSSGELIDRYVGALVRELELVAADLRPRTIYFGGGTPSLLNLRQWERILGAMERLRLGGAEEWTVECNPATVSLDKARLLRSGGVNRMSMGVQSLNAALLDRLGRVHTREMAFKSFDILRQAGFDNLNLDLMFAIPGQTLEVWRETLREATAMGSEHLSSYEVIYEEDTALYDQLQAGKVNADEDLACAMYEELVERATMPASSNTKWPTSPAPAPSTLNPQPSTSPATPAVTMSTTGGAVPFMALAPARRAMSAACGLRPGPTPNSTASSLSRGNAPSNPARSWRRWPVPERRRLLACAWWKAGRLSSSARQPAMTCDANGRKTWTSWCSRAGGGFSRTASSLQVKAFALPMPPPSFPPVTGKDKGALPPRYVSFVGVSAFCLPVLRSDTAEGGLPSAFSFKGSVVRGPLFHFQALLELCGSFVGALVVALWWLYSRNQLAINTLYGGFGVALRWPLVAYQ